MFLPWSTPSSVSRRSRSVVRSDRSRSRGRAEVIRTSWAMCPSASTARGRRGERLVDVVRDQQDGGAMALPELEHQPVDRDAGQGVQRRERLVEQQQPGLANQRSGQRGALRLAAGQRERPGLLWAVSPTSASASPATRLGVGARGRARRSPRTRFHGSSRGPGRRSPPRRRREIALTPGPDPRARGAASTCPSRCGRSARRTRRARCRGPARRAPGGLRTSGDVCGARATPGARAGRAGTPRRRPCLAATVTRQQAAVPCQRPPLDGPARASR